MVVYIFPIDLDMVMTGELGADVVDDKIKALGLTVKNIDPLYREEARKVWVKPSPDAEEVPTKDSIIVVDPDLGFTADDIADDFSFGNGTTVGGVRLKDDRWIPCGFTVFDHADMGRVDTLRDQLKMIFKGRRT